MKNYGLKIDKIKPTDYIFGSALPFEEINASGDWTSFLPYKEYQNLNGIEPFACVSFTILNCLEMLVKKQYGEDRNWSDRFLASISGTKEGGNSPVVVCDFLRKLGVVPQDIFPFDEKITSFEEFYSPIPQELYNIAKEFLAEFEFKYEFVPDDKEQIKKALKCSPLLLSVVAWFSKDDKYVRPEGMADNHATTLIAVKEGEYKRVFDSYADGEGDPFLKDYEWNAPHSIIMRFWIKKREIVSDTVLEIKDTKSDIRHYNWVTEIMANLLAFIKDIVLLIKAKALGQKTIRWIICHHTGGTDFNKWEDTSSHTFETVNKYHQQKWNAKSSLGYYIGYQYYIDKTGKLTQGRADTDRGLHTIGYNEDSIGICLAGNFDLTKPNEAQIKTLKDLLKRKQQQYAIPTSNIFAHRRVASKTCYGLNLSNDWARNLVIENTYSNKAVIDLIKILISLKIITDSAIIKLLPFMGRKLGRIEDDKECEGHI